MDNDSRRDCIAFLNVDGIVVIYVALTRFLRDGMVGREGFAIFVLRPPTIGTVYHAVLDVQFRAYVGISGVHVVGRVVV